MARIKIDGTRIQTLRTILLAALAALGVVLLGALGLRQLKHRGLSLDLPGQLQANIQQTANGFTWSESKGGHTLFTIHASKLVQFKADQAQLHNVAITLYGPPGSHRIDHISGSEFFYDKKQGIVTATGSVDIALTSPTKAAGDTSQGNSIHIRTSKLRFDQATGEASTPAPLFFTLSGATGQAVGGDYNSKTGVLVLQSAVQVQSTAQGNMSTVRAEHAELLRDSHVAYLLHAVSEYEGSKESADQAILHLRPDGSLAHLDAEDHVHMTSADADELYASNASADFDAKSQPLRAYAGGGVNFVSDNGASNMHGNAVQGTMLFATGADGKAAIHHLQLRNAVSLVMQQNGFRGNPNGSATREMTASKVDVDFIPGPAGHSLAQKVLAQGGATVNLHDLPYGAPPSHTAVSGSQLVALLAHGHDFQQLDGQGGTKLTQFAPDGAIDTSTGDTLHMTFNPAEESHPVAAKTLLGDSVGSAQVKSAIQTGHVNLKAAPARGAKTKDGQPQQPWLADANVAEYSAAEQTLRLTGGDPSNGGIPRVHNDSMNLTAKTVVYHRDTAVAFAQGDVRATALRQPGAPAKTQAGIGGSGPVHIVASQAELQGASDLTTFTGTKQDPARLWQGASSVTAPVIAISKSTGTLDAHAAPSDPTPIHAVLAGKPGAQPARVTAGSLFYAESTRAGEFKNDVSIAQPSGTVHADDAQFFLMEAAPGEASGLERMVATGKVVLTQPGRKGTGSRLVYTAADGHYLLTGTPSEPPRATDTQHGSTTGAALLFKGGDNSVEVLNSDPDGETRRTVTDTRTPK